MSTAARSLSLIKAATRVFFVLGLMISFAVASLVASGGLQTIFFVLFLGLGAVELVLMVALWRRTFEAASGN